MPPIPRKKPLTRKQKNAVLVKLASRIASRVIVHKLLVRMGAPRYVAYSVAMINQRLIELADPISEDDFVEALSIQVPDAPKARAPREAAAKRP